MSRSNHVSKHYGGGREYWSARYTPTVPWGTYGKRLTHRFERHEAKLAIPNEFLSYQDEQTDRDWLYDDGEWYDDWQNEEDKEPWIWTDPSNQNQTLARLGDVLKSA